MSAMFIILLGIFSGEIAMSISRKDALRLIIPIFIASISADFLFNVLGVRRGGLIFTENFDSKYAAIHAFAFFVFFCGMYWLLGEFTYFKKKPD